MNVGLGQGWGKLSTNSAAVGMGSGIQKLHNLGRDCGQNMRVQAVLEKTFKKLQGYG